MVAIDVELVGSRVVMVGLNEGIHGLNDAIFASGAGGEPPAGTLPSAARS